MNFTRIQNTLFFGLLAVITFIFFWLFFQFITPIFWATVLAIVFFPLYSFILKLFKNKEALSAFVTVIIILKLFFLPIYGLGFLITKEAIVFYKDLNQTEVIQNVSVFSAPVETALNSFGIKMQKGDIQSRFITFIKSISATIASLAIDFGKATTQAILSFFITLYLLFFAFKDGVAFLRRIEEILPLGDEREEKLFFRFVEIVRSIFKGTFIIAFIQGLVGALTLLIVGIPHILLWGTLMALLSIIPALGPVVVLLPITLILFVSGLYVKAIILIAGIIITSLLDNILRPILVGKDTKMHDAVIMISVLGGLSLFGFSGFVIGPVIAGLFITFWSIFEEDYKKELKEKG